jgi:hypothetical protein
MSQAHEQKDSGEHAPHVGSSPGDAATPGKRTRAEESAPKDAAGEVQRLKDEVHDAYVGAGSFEQRGILDHKFDAIQDVKDYLNKDDDTIGPDLLSAAVTIGAAAAAGALAAATGGTGVVLAALIAGGGAVASELPGFLGSGGRRGPPLDPIAFCSRYKTALRQFWPGSVNKLFSQMNTVDEARFVHQDILSVRSKAETVKENQSHELLDAWVNALKTKTQKNSPAASMGSEDFNDSTAGRLHVEGIVIDELGDGATKVDVEGLRAKLTAVPQDARNQMLGRKVGDVRVARTIEGSVRRPPVVRAGPPAEFAFGVLPGGSLARPEKEVSHVAQGALAGIAGAGTWEKGLAIIWDKIRGRTLASLGVASVEN